MPLFRIAHLSDPHLGPLPPARPAQLASKRLFGYVNWHRNRSKGLAHVRLESLLEEIGSRPLDHVAITGDLVNIALPDEFHAARGFLEALGPADRVSLVPGNHDAYVPGALARAYDCWRPYMTGDVAPPDGSIGFPYVRRRGPIAIVGVSTAIATPPLMATGKVGISQTAALGRVLEELDRQGLFRIVLIHHPPVRSQTRWHKRLVDSDRVRAVLAHAGCELILHGHTHRRSLDSVPGPRGPIAVVGVPAASSAAAGHDRAAGFNLLEIDTERDRWSCTLIERRIEAGTPRSAGPRGGVRGFIPVPPRGDRAAAVAGGAEGRSW